LQSTGKGVGGADIAQVPKTDQQDVSRLRSFRRFADPTAVELVRLIKPKSSNCPHAQADERANSFARLLNRGSSLE